MQFFLFIYKFICLFWLSSYDAQVCFSFYPKIRTSQSGGQSGLVDLCEVANHFVTIPIKFDRKINIFIRFINNSKFISYSFIINPSTQGEDIIGLVLDK